MIRTTTATLSLTLLASALMAVSAQAATPPALRTNLFGEGNSDAGFAGGATTNGGDSFVQTIPFNAPPGIVAQIATGSEAGKEADLFMVATLNNNWYMRTASGWRQWNTRVADLQPFTTKVLDTTETIAIPDLEAQAGVSLDGATLRLHVGFMTDTSPLVYSSAIEFSLASQPSGGSGKCPTGSESLPPLAGGSKRLCVISGTYTSDLHLSAEFEYIISGAVFIGEDNRNSATLTMDAGVKTYGESGLDFIVINRGSKISVNGTRDNPVIMTSANDAEADATTRGQWGGLIINGNAPVNGCTAGTSVCELQGEGSTGLYGGNDPHDSSGNLNYLQVRYAGFNITPDNELNGIALQGVGDGTIIDYVQVHNNSDDGIEFFGGTVNAKHLVLTGNEDDSLDWTFGWQGKVQHVVIVTGPDRANNGFEADNNATNRDASPRSQPKIANVTLIGNANATSGLLLREGTGANLYNFVVTGFGSDCIDIDHAATFIAAGGSVNTLNGTLTMTNSRVDCAVNFREEAGDNFTVQAWFEAQDGNTAGATDMDSYINSALVNGLPAATLTDPFFDQTDYIGAVKDEASDWTQGWTFRP
jgi:hypothetical protein